MFHPHLETVLPAYDAALGRRAALEPDLFGFYRRNLEDIAVWVAQLLDNPAGEAEDAHRLEELEHWGLGWWPSLESDLAAIRRALEAHNRTLHSSDELV